VKLNQANQTALRRCRDIQAQIDRLTVFVAQREVMARENKIPDWGYVGDLGHIQDKLGELHCLQGGAQ
jgi:hypothetical protein